jgi:hypothetical protein
LLQDAELRCRYEAAAAATARQYDWSVITERFGEVLQKVIDGTSGGQAAPSAPTAAKT